MADLNTWLQAEKRDFVAAVTDEMTGAAARRRQAEKERQEWERSELPGRVETHAFMRHHRWEMAGMMQPCIHAHGEKHSKICDDLETFRLGR